MFSFQQRPSILIDPDKQAALEAQGYVNFKILTADQVRQLEALYYSIHKDGGNGFFPSTYKDDVAYRTDVYKSILAIVEPAIDQHFSDIKKLMASFIVKHADDNSELGLHQDMTLVDEEQFDGVNIWIPLCDTNLQNGGLHLIPKSHRFMPTYRGPSIPNIYDQHAKKIINFMQPVFVEAGEAIVFNHSILHFSPANQSGKIRIAVNVFVSNKAAKVRIAYFDGAENQIELFEQNDDFFLKYKQFETNNTIPPQIGKSIGTRKYNFPQLNKKTIEQHLGVKSTSIFSKLKNAFS